MEPTQSHKGTFRLSAKPLTAREAYQVLRDIALGVRTMRRLGEKSWTEMYSCMMTVEQVAHGLNRVTQARSWLLPQLG